MVEPSPCRLPELLKLVTSTSSFLIVPDETGGDDDGIGVLVAILRHGGGQDRVTLDRLQEALWCRRAPRRGRHARMRRRSAATKRPVLCGGFPCDGTDSWNNSLDPPALEGDVGANAEDGFVADARGRVDRDWRRRRPAGRHTGSPAGPATMGRSDTGRSPR